MSILLRCLVAVLAIMQGKGIVFSGADGISGRMYPKMCFKNASLASNVMNGEVSILIKMENI
jgi:hypothetical protein